MSYIQATVIERTILLALDGVPATGIPYTAVTAATKKQGATVFSAFTLTALNWIELGSGYYTIIFSADDSDTLGTFVYKLSSVSFNNFTHEEFSIEPAPPPPLNVVLPTQCIVSGNVANLSSNPPTSEPLKITAYLPNFPAKVGNTILVGDQPFTFADAYGNFSLALVRNSTVIIEIKRAGIRNQITVPDAPTANLVDLLPSFVVDYSL